MFDLVISRVQRLPECINKDVSTLQVLHNFIFPSHLSTFHLKQIRTRKVSLASRFHQHLLVSNYTFPILAFPRRSPMHFNHAPSWKHKYWIEMVTETIFSREEEIKTQTLCAERGRIRWNLERAQKSTKCHFLFRWKMIMSSHNASCTAADIWWESAFFFSFPISPSRTRFLRQVPASSSNDSVVEIAMNIAHNANTNMCPSRLNYSCEKLFLVLVD